MAAQPSFLSPYRRGTVGLLLLLGTGLSLLTCRYVDRQESERIHAGFLSRAQTQATVAAQHLRNYEEMIYSLRDSFLGQQTVTRGEFSNVARALLQRHAGVQALEWVQIVPHAQRTALEQLATSELGRPFVIRRRNSEGELLPAPLAPEYIVITYVEPLANNEPVLGYDLTSAPTAQLIATARASRQFQVTQTFRLIQSSGAESEPGVIFMLPFARPDPPDSPVEGIVQGVFHVQAMLAQSHSLNTNEALDTYYLDAGSGQEPLTLLYANLGGTEPGRLPGAKVTLPPLDDPADFHVTLRAGHRQWRMIIRKNAAWAAGISSRQPELILLAGLVITALLALFINSLLQRTSRIEQEVQERTRQLRASEARLQDILDHSPALIFLKDLEGRFLLCNQAFCKYSRRSQREIIGHMDADFVPAKDAQHYREMDAQVLAAGRPVEFETKAGEESDGSVYLAHRFPLFNEQGRPYAICGIATDITDRQAAEEHKHLLERKLLEAQKLESLGVLAGGIAHDFNNILTAILGNATLAGMDLPENHKVQQKLRQIEHAARRAGDLCAQMLAYAGKAAFVTAPVNLNSLVRDTTALLEVTVGKRAQLELRFADDLPAVMGDITQLRQIVMNLVINAADAIGDRTGGIISVSTHCRDLPAEFFLPAVQSPPLPAGRYVSLEVRDNGKGMTPEVMARIFEPFFTTKFSGRGLGLAAVLGIIQSHDGALFVESTEGQGTVFRLFLPTTLAPTDASTPPFDPIAVAASLQGTVLLVDDEPAVRHVTTHALTAMGLRALEAPDGQTALDLYRAQPASIDLVLLDLMMPGLSGEETLRRLREINPAVRVIVMSGFSEGETMQRCAELGVLDFLPKPFEIVDLKTQLRRHLA